MFRSVVFEVLQDSPLKAFLSFLFPITWPDRFLWHETPITVCCNGVRTPSGSGGRRHLKGYTGKVQGIMMAYHQFGYTYYKYS